MSNFRNRVELWFGALARKLYRHPILSLIIMVLLMAAFVSQLHKITIDTSNEGFLHETDPALIDYYKFRDQFGREEIIIVAIKPPEVFTFSFLEKLKRLHEELRDNVPYIEDITSLINARNTRGKGNELIVEDLLENWPESEAALKEIKERALNNEMYKNMLISEDGKFTTIAIQTQNYTSTGQEIDVLDGFDEMDIALDDQKSDVDYLTDRENSEAVNTVRTIVERYRSPDFEIYLAGSPVVVHFLKQNMMKDMRKFMLLAFLTIALFLFLMFRRISGVVFPLLIVIASLLSTLGLMAFFGTPIKLPTQILPSFLMAVSVGDAVHIMAIFYHRYKQSGDKEDAVTYAVGHSGLAILMTSLTTAGGLFSFANAELAPISDLGIYSGIGVTLALTYTIVLLPALISITPIKPGGNTEHKSPLMDRLLYKIGEIAAAHPIKILMIASIIIAISIVGITRIKFSHYVLKWFPKDNSIRLATEKIDEELRGSITLEVIIDTGKTNGLYDPDMLNRLEASADYVESLQYEEIFVGKAWSLTTILKEINQALNENREEYYRIPDNKALIPQEFLLFENSGSDDLEDVTDSQFSKARFTVKMPFRDAVSYTEFIKMVSDHFRTQYPDAEITSTGMTYLFFRTVTNAIHTMAKSYTIALVVITIMMIILIGKFRIGLLSMIPNLFPIVLTMGIMEWFNMPMDLFTMLVGSIAIGLAVDDTIHFMHNFRRYFEQSGDPKWAVMETLHTTGRAMLVTSCVLSVGFLILIFASMNNIRNFGILTGFTIIMALMADYFIAPALMILVNRPKSGTEKTASDG